MNEGYASLYVSSQRLDAFDEENITDTKYGKDMIMEVGIRMVNDYRKKNFQ